MRIVTCKRLIDLMQDSKLSKEDIEWAIAVLQMEINRQETSWKLSQIKRKEFGKVKKKNKTKNKRRKINK